MADIHGYTGKHASLQIVEECVTKHHQETLSCGWRNLAQLPPVHAVTLHNNTQKGRSLYSHSLAMNDYNRTIWPIQS